MSPHLESNAELSFRDDSAASVGADAVSNTTITPGYPISIRNENLQDSDASSVDSTDVGIRRVLTPGFYVPTLAFFDSKTEALDLQTTAQHAVRLAQSGVAGLATQGSNGEAVHLSHQERNQITATTRKALDEAGFDDMPIIVGCGSQSTRETAELCIEAQAAGGDYALVLPPSYYKGLLTPDAITSFFTDVATASPIPILIYNYPAASGGLDLTSEVIISLSHHPNIAGCKLTCGNTGKLNRIVTATRAATASEPGSGFMCLGGSADFTLQTIIAGGSGTLGGLGNIAPRACVRLTKLAFLAAAGGTSGNELRDARKMQGIVARGDEAAINGGIVGLKAAMQAFFSYGGFARKPLPRPSKDESKHWTEAFQELVDLERPLE